MSDRMILVVEDDPGDQMLLRMALESGPTKPKLRMFDTCEDALAFLAQSTRDANEASPNKIGLLLLDFNLPGMNGNEMVARVRASSQTRFLPAVILSGSARDIDVAAAYASGANAYVRKALDFEKFVQSLQSIITFWLHENVQPG